MLVAPQTQELTPIVDRSVWKKPNVQEELLKNYDNQLDSNENPDPNMFAILLMLSADLPSDTIHQLQSLDLEIKNHRLRLAARIVARLDIPDGSGVPLDLFYGHKVHNMIAALSLPRYTEGRVTQYTESLLLASFLESRELVISSVALEYYMKTTISNSDPLAPSCYLSTAVSAAFNFTLPHHQLRMGWSILEIFLDGFEKLSVEWRRAFAEGFFTLSRQPLSRSHKHMEPSTPESELKNILTWDYFHKEEQEPEFTDSEFSGLDWMAMAWSLHLSRHAVRRTEGRGQREKQSQNLSQPTVNEEFVLRVLCKLLDAASSSQITPIIPKICEFVQWFDNTELPEYSSMISTWGFLLYRRVFSMYN